MSKQRDENIAIFSEDLIKSMAEEAAYIAKFILQIEWFPHSIVFIDKPRIKYDAFVNIETNEIQLNLGKIQPLPECCFENHCGIEKRFVIAIYNAVYHEIRHIYQNLVVRAYLEKWPYLYEKREVCELWQKDLNTSVSDILEKDANDFAYYLAHRFPIRGPMAETNKMRNEMKKKYDMIELPPGLPDNWI